MKHFRRLVQHSTGYLMFLIPKSFQRRHKLVAGDYIEVTQRGNTLILKVLKEGENERASLKG